MPPVIREIEARSALGRTGIPGYDRCLNPYVGCLHACRYCYADFMRRYSGHEEPWGGFVDVRVNLPELLAREVRRGPPRRVLLSSVTDPYQPAEARYGLTRRSLEILLGAGWAVGLLTKSPLVLRDLDLLTGGGDVSVGITVTTDDDRVRRTFEPGAPPIAARFEALAELSRAGVATWVFVGPILPMDPARLGRLIAPWTREVVTDRMNYAGKTGHLYRSGDLRRWLDESVLAGVEQTLRRSLHAAADSTGGP